MNEFHSLLEITMAYPAPPTLAAGAITLPTPITTYLQKYQEQGDALEGHYQEFLAPYAHTVDELTRSWRQGSWL